MRTDTCAMAAISLNLQQKVHPIIWSVANLPFDCTRAVPIKKPLGGTLVFAVNALIYLNQSIPPYGVSLNSIADQSTNFPLSKLVYFFITLCTTVYFSRAPGRHLHQFRLCSSWLPGRRCFSFVAQRWRTLCSNTFS